jgi:hypothetical protein
MLCSESMRVTHASQHASTPDKVVEILASEAYNLDVERHREGVIETRFEVVSRTPEHVVFRLRTSEHGRTKTGGIDRSRVLHSTTDSEVDLRGRVVTWRYGTEDGSRVRLSGTLRVEQAPESSRVVQAVDIEVSIPIIGGQIAKLIGRKMEKSLPETAKALDRHLR